MQSMHLKAVTAAHLNPFRQFSAARQRAAVLRPRQVELRQQRHLARAAAESEGDSKRGEDDEDYQLRRDVKSVARTVLEGKPLLQDNKAIVYEEEAKERFFGRLAVLSLGVRPLLVDPPLVN